MYVCSSAFRLYKSIIASISCSETESVDSVSPVAVVVVEGVLVLVQGKAGMEVDWQLQSICIQCNIMHTSQSVVGVKVPYREQLTVCKINGNLLF